MPEEFFSRLKKSIKKEWKIAFFSAITIGFLTHMYVFTNMLPNHDGLINIYSSQLRLTSGRFFLGPFSGISSFFDLPWIIGSLSVLYLALTAVVLTAFFELHKTPAIILTAGLIVTFPTVAATFSYMFTADGYMMGILLAVLALLITKNYRFGFFPASFIFYLSVGIYQANLPVVLAAVTVWLIRELVFNEMKIKRLFYSLVRYAVMIVIGMGFYAVTYNAYQKIFDGEISSYQGLNQIGQHSDGIADQFIKIKDTAMEFFFRGFVTESPINLFEVLNLLVAILILVGVVISVIQHKVYRSPIRICLILFNIILLPIVAFLLYFVSSSVIYHMLMVMALVPMYLLPIVIYDGLKKPTLTVKWFSWGAVIVLFLTMFNFTIISNISYFNMALKYEKSYAFVNRMIDRVEQIDGYENVVKFAVIGRPLMRSGVSSSRVPDNIPHMTGTTGENFLVESYHFIAMLHNYFGEPIRGVNGEQLQVLKESDLVKQMKPWPSKDSIRIEGDVVIIKLSN